MIISAHMTEFSMSLDGTYALLVPRNIWICGSLLGRLAVLLFPGGASRSVSSFDALYRMSTPLSRSVLFRCLMFGINNCIPGHLYDVYIIYIYVVHIYILRHI